MTNGAVPMPDRDGLIGDDERQLTIEVVQRAMVADAIEFEELDERFAAIFRAETKSELAAVVADLPQPPAPSTTPALRGHLVPASNTSIFGDIKVGGWTAVEGDIHYRTIFGDLVIDLSSAELPEMVTIATSTVFGDITVIVPDGARTSINSRTVFGSRKSNLGPAYTGSSTVRIDATTFFGDTKVFSLSRIPKGKLRKLWKALRAQV